VSGWLHVWRARGAVLVSLAGNNTAGCSPARQGKNGRKEPSTTGTKEQPRLRSGQLGAIVQAPEDSRVETGGRDGDAVSTAVESTVALGLCGWVGRAERRR
jgi:hypothetical protein